MWMKFSPCSPKKPDRLCPVSFLRFVKIDFTNSNKVYLEYLLTRSMSSTDIISFVKNFDILDDDLSQKLYLSYLSAFKNSMEETVYIKMNAYEGRMFNMIENIRDMSVDFIVNILDFFNKENPYVADLILIMWCLPRSGVYFSSFMYDKMYKQNIEKYNSKIVNILTNDIVRNFCIETITKINNVPIHCIDYIWHYIHVYTIEFEFNNDMMRKFIFIKKIENEVITVGIDMSYMILLGLGNQSVRDIVKKVMSDDDYLNSCSKNNYISQKQKLISLKFIS